jgi:hypothetical protein
MPPKFAHARKKLYGYSKPPQSCADGFPPPETRSPWLQYFYRVRRAPSKMPVIESIKGKPGNVDPTRKCNCGQLTGRADFS